jgi:hypothetical protein
MQIITRTWFLPLSHWLGRERQRPSQWHQSQSTMTDGKWKMRLFAVPALLALLAVAAFAGDDAQQLNTTLPDKAPLFQKVELTLRFPEKIQAVLDQLPDTQIHDAYDADRDGMYVRISAAFTLGDETVNVPAFAMREHAGGPWVWRVRYSPRHAGAVDVTLHLDACLAKNALPLAIATHLELPLLAEISTLPGPLISPEKPGQPPLLRTLKPDGSSAALWLFGACRAWVVDSQDPKNDWVPDEWLDRETELFKPMRASGYNLLNQWMAPWEFLLVHHDRAEFWKDDHDKFKRVALPKTNAWTPYQSFDQGRAAAFDRLVERCESDPAAGKDIIYLLLAPLPHQAFEVTAHPWGESESGWSPGDDKGKQSLERLNGFSEVVPIDAKTRLHDVWDFFAADPSRPLPDWRSQLFDYQANFYRYVIARWGYSSAIGVWVLADELDAVGDVVGNYRIKTGWWGHPECESWLANTVRLFKGKLKRSDGLEYSGDPFKHPLHAASTSARGQAERGGNIDWDGGPADAQPDLFGFHWYPYWPKGSTWTDVWDYTIDGVMAYSRSPIGNHPRLLSEFGAEDRAKPADEPSYLYPTMYHHGAWSAIFSGHAGTPLDWDDGKEFGELTARDRAGIFDKEHYPIDNAAQLRALRKFLAPLHPDALRACSAADATVTCSAEGHGRACALYEPQHTSVYGWMFAPSGETVIALRGLASGRYTLTWFDPWTGEAVGTAKELELTASKGAIGIDAREAFAELKRADPFPKKSRLSRGQDVAFKLESHVVELTEKKEP